MTDLKNLSLADLNYDFHLILMYDEDKMAPETAESLEYIPASENECPVGYIYIQD